MTLISTVSVCLCSCYFVQSALVLETKWCHWKRSLVLLADRDALIHLSFFSSDPITISEIWIAIVILKQYQSSLFFITIITIIISGIMFKVIWGRNQPLVLWCWQTLFGFTWLQSHDSMWSQKFSDSVSQFVLRRDSGFGVGMILYHFDSYTGTYIHKYSLWSDSLAISVWIYTAKSQDIAVQGCITQHLKWIQLLYTVWAKQVSHM